MDKTEQRIDKVPLQQQLHTEKKSAFTRYKEKAVGQLSWRRFLLYEVFCLLLADIGGAMGYVVRKWAAGSLLAATGSGLILGKGLVVRHPGKVVIGDRVALDDNIFIDASGSGERGVRLEDGVILSRNCVVQGKTGHVVLEERVDVGCNCVFSSVAGITVGAATIIAANCYIGGGRYYSERLDTPIMDQGGYSRGAITIGPGSWIGAGAVILDGVSLGKGVIVGAGSVVTRDVPDNAVVAGVPAKIIKMRKE